ncbi:GNAT family N-acetyltransferase [Patescibacteria group bacterium]|nr:GNAT family N-acetyltransferase [Patescibacteria group bacterium]
MKKIRYYFTPTYDIDYVKYSPGKILLQHIIKDSFDKGYEFDFMN